MNPTMNVAPLTINFTNTSVGDGLSYSWNFGDGGTSNQASPTHTFQAGAWEVILTVTNANGTDQTSTTIVALPQQYDDPPPGYSAGSGGPPPGCFIAGTLIQLPDGVKSIENIEVIKYENI